MSESMMFDHSILMGLFSFAVGLFIWGGWTDMRSMRIPNLVSLGLIIAWCLRAVLVPETVSLIGDPLFAVAVFVPFFVLYAVGNGGFGAGDVKLITTGALWFGWSGLPQGLSSFIPAEKSLAIGFLFLVAMGVAGLFQSLYAMAWQWRRNNPGERGPLARLFTLFRPQSDGRVYVTAATATALSSAMEGAREVVGSIGIVREVEGKLRIPYGPSIVAGAFFAFWCQLAAWGILS